MQEEVFISYVHEDKELAHQVHDFLEAHGISCWIDSHDITTGTNWTASIMDALNQCHLMIFVLSNYSNNATKQVLRELQCADTRNIPIIPLSVEGILPLAELEYFLATQQLLEITLPPTKAQLDDVVIAAQFHLSQQEFYKRKYAIAEALIRKQHWSPCAAQCLEILELALKYLLKNLINSLEDLETKKAILAVQKAIADSEVAGSIKQDFEDSTFPQMIRLYNEAGIFHELKKQLCSQLHLTTTLTNWHRLETIWYKSKDNSGVAPCREDEARDVMFWVKNILYESNILGVNTQQSKPTIQSKPMNSCRSCNSPTIEEWRFCPQCGDSMKLECIVCHKTLQAEWKRCPYCDSPVRGVQSSSKESTQLEDEYRTLCRGAWFDGVLSIRERQLLDKKRLELGLSVDIADRIERECAPQNVIEYTHFVEGVFIDGVITDIERVFLDKKASLLGIDPWVAKQIEETQWATSKSIS